MKMIAIKICVFQNKRTKEYRWLSLESQEGMSGRYLCKSGADSVDQLVIIHFVTLSAKLQAYEVEPPDPTPPEQEHR